MNYLRKMRWLLLAVMIAGIVSCKKETSDVQKTGTESIENYNTLHRFVAVTFHIPEDKLQFDLEKKEFFLPNTIFRFSLEEAQQYYAVANVYKEQYEK